MSWLQKNLDALSQHQGELVEALKATESLLPQCENTPDGYKTVRLHGDSGPWVHSRRAPAREIQRIVERPDVEALQPVIVLGSGLGYAIAESMKHHSKSPHILFEENLPLLKAALELHDFSKPIREHKLAVAVDIPSGMVLDIFDHFRTDFSAHGMQNISHSYTSGNSLYSDRFKQLAEWVRIRMMTMRTQMSRARLNVENMLLNLPHYLVGVGIQKLYFALKGTPGILIGAGPSLVRNIDVLKEYQDKAYFQVVSSAMKRVMREGLPVHGTNVVDYSHSSQRYFVDLPDSQPEPPLLWFQARCSHSVLDAWQGQMVSSDDDLYRLLFEGELELKGYSPVEGNNVAHYGYASLRALGCDPIILVGMDQALSFHTSHTPGIALHDEWSASNSRFMSLEQQEFRICYVIADRSVSHNDRYGNPVMADQLLENAAISFENIFSRDSGVTVYNCTEGGRPMKGAEDRDLRDVLEEYCTKPFDPEELNRRVAEAQSDSKATLKRGLEVMEQVGEETEALKAILREGKRKLKKAQKDVLKGKTPRGAEEAVEALNTGVKKYRRVYAFIKTFTMGDDHQRKKLDRELASDDLTPVARMRLEIQREHNFLIALERAVKKWEEVYEIGIARLRLAVEQGIDAVDQFDAEGRLAELEVAE